MSISITRADIKRKCMLPISDTAYDSSIDSLIAEMQAALEYTVLDAYFTDTGNVGLQALLKLGIMEIISGEFLQQLAREAGVMEQFSVGGVTVGEMKERGPALIQQGSSRLAPYLKCVQPAMPDASIQSTMAEAELIFSNENLEAGL